MRLLSASVLNFASYEQLHFTFADNGLALVYGATGSGKSTLQDIPIWALYGITSKNGSVDEVRNWKNKESRTQVTIAVAFSDNMNEDIQVTRIRGKNNENDLFWVNGYDSNEKHRGKDLQDTQKLLNARLGMDADEYCQSANFNEFSDASLFFLAKAKDKRALFENISSLQFAVDLSDKASKARKEAKSQVVAEIVEIKHLKGQLLAIEDRQEAAIRGRDSFEESHKRELVMLKKIADGWDTINSNIIKELELEKNVLSAKKNELPCIKDVDSKLSDLEDKITATRLHKCPTCKQQLNAAIREDLIYERSKSNEVRDKILRVAVDIRQVDLEIRQTKEAKNNYFILLEESNKKINPFIEQLKDASAKWEEVHTKLTRYELDLCDVEYRLSGLNKLYDLSAELRGALLQKSVQQIESSTNSYLEKYFDGEFRVTFSLAKADGLEVSIQKNGYECVYTQLSKGQRGLLKLCFVISVMEAVANKAGIHMSNLFLDEALDGLDSELKVKAYGLLEELATRHESVLVIDHAPEFHNLFHNRYHVSLNDDVSTIEHENE